MRTKYILKAELFVGKGSTLRDKRAGQYYVTKLTVPYHGSNRYVIMDKRFISVPLTNKLNKDPYNLTFIGTMKDKLKIPITWQTLTRGC